MLRTHEVRGRSTGSRTSGVAGSVGDLAVVMVGAEVQNRVLATAADLALGGRSITSRELVRLTGLEPESVDRCLEVLCERHLLSPVSGPSQQYVFPDSRWPVTLRDG